MSGEDPGSQRYQEAESDLDHDRGVGVSLLQAVTGAGVRYAAEMSPTKFLRRSHSFMTVPA